MEEKKYSQKELDKKINTYSILFAAAGISLGFGIGFFVASKLWEKATQ